jgi:lipopolysaccharide biosynthesis protein
VTVPPETPAKPIAVFVHAHYPDIWAEMSERLGERLMLPFHLVVTTARPEEIVLPRTPALLSSRIMPVENRGRDVLPFLRALAEAGEFELGLKLHTKKSPQRADGAHWRKALLDDLVPSPPGVAEVVRRLRDDHRIGFVAPTNFSLSVAPWILANESGMRRVLSTLGRNMNEEDLRDVFFAAGSMFWFRRDALAPLATPEVFALFEPEEGQLDGTIAHATERLLPIVARQSGFASLALSALRESQPGMTDEELASLARRHADRPTTYLPGPGIPELPPGAPLPVALARTPSAPTAAPVPKLLMPMLPLLRAVLPVSLRHVLGRLLGRLRRS